MSGDFAEEAPPEPDPLEGLIERATNDVAEAYRPEVIKALIALRRTQGTRAYVKLRDQLKGIKGFNTREFTRDFDVEWSKQFAGLADPEDVVTQLTRVAQKAYYFVDDQNDDVVFAELPNTLSGIAVPVLGKQYQRWLINEFMDQAGRPPGRDAFKVALDGVDARAVRQGVKHPVFIRVGQHNGKVYVDRGLPEAGSFVEIDAEGWRIVSETPVRFRRPSKGLVPLPEPVKGGDIKELRKFLNLKDDRDFALFVGWILSCFRPDRSGEYALMLVLGTHGDGKTTLLVIALAFVDPVRRKPMRSPRTDQDVIVVAAENFVLGIDNMKPISVERSAVCCTVLTGSWDESRTLFTNKETTSILGHCPLAMTATEMIVTEEDLADRTIVVRTGDLFHNTPGKPKQKRKTAEKVKAEFDKEWPAFLGCFYDAVSAGLRNTDMDEPELPRLADVALWLHRCEPGLGENWQPGTMVEAMHAAVHDIATDVADHDPVASAVVAFMHDKTIWGPHPFTELWSTLRTRAGFKTGDKTFPGSPSIFSRRLSALIVILRRNGIIVLRDRDNRANTVTLERVLAQGKPNGAGEPDSADTTAAEAETETWRPVP